MRASLRHSGADSTFSPVLWSVSEFKQRLDSRIEASHRAWEGNLIRRPCDQLHHQQLNLVQELLGFFNVPVHETFTSPAARVLVDAVEKGRA